KLTYDHSLLPFWYAANANRFSPGSGKFVAGIDWSILSPDSATNPWKAGNYIEQGRDTGVFGSTSIAAQEIQSLVKLTVDDFQDATNWIGRDASIIERDVGNFAARITFGSDGYLYRD